MAKKIDKADKIIDASLKLAESEGWHDLTLSSIAAAAKLGVGELARIYPSKAAILAAWSRRIDAEVLAATDAEKFTDESARDRLFDVLMMRFDALLPYRPALKRISQDLSQDLFAVAPMIRPALQSLGWMLEAADIDTSGLRGALRVRGLALIWVRVLRVWLEDGEDQAKTMAELDKRLRQAEGWFDKVSRMRGRPTHESAA